jgi:transcriptional regulator
MEQDVLPKVTLFENEFEITDEHDGLITISELKEYLPSMKSGLFNQLKADIEVNGIHDPILFYEPEDGKKLVVEGHTRLKVAVELNLAGESLPRQKVNEQFNSLTDIKLWMLRHQFQRRNLSAPQKLRLAMEHKSTIEVKAKENLSKSGKRIRVNQRIDTALEIANMAGVSRETAKRYMKVYEKGSPELLNELDDGKVSIYNATYKLKPVKNEQANKPIPRIVGSVEEGVSIMDTEDISAVIVVKNEETIKNFLPTLYNKYVFCIK